MQDLELYSGPQFRSLHTDKALCQSFKNPHKTWGFSVILTIILLWTKNMQNQLELNQLVLYIVCFLVSYY